MKYILSFTLALNILAASPNANGANASANLSYPKLVNTFYSQNENNMLWTGVSNNAANLRNGLVTLISKAAYLGLDKDQYHYEYISSALQLYNDMDADRVFTDAAISFFKDVYAGRMTDGMMGYDGVSGTYDARDNDRLINELLKVQDAPALSIMAANLEPRDNEYLALKMELAKQIDSNAKEKVKALSISLNYYRRIHHYNFSKCIW